MKTFVLKTLPLLALLILGAASLAGCSDNEARADVPKETKKVKVGIVTVQPEPLKDLLVLPGETEAIKDVQLSAEWSGRVEWIGPDEGDPVNIGQVIAEIDQDALQAALEKAEAAYKLSKKQAERRQSLYKEDVLSKEELEQVLTELKLSEGNLQEARVAYEQGLVRSPIAGMVDRLHVDPGEYVNPGSPVAELVDVDVIRVTVNVPEMDVRFLENGQKVLVKVDAYPDEQWEGEIEYVAYKADGATKTFEVSVLVDNHDGRIRPGMLARSVFVRRYIPDAVTAPLFAVQDKGGERILFVEKDGKAQARTVTPGIIDGDKVQILEGLEPGEHLIVVGHTDVEDGMEVVVQ